MVLKVRIKLKKRKDCEADDENKAEAIKPKRLTDVNHGSESDLSPQVDGYTEGDYTAKCTSSLKGTGSIHLADDSAKAITNEAKSFWASVSTSSTIREEAST